MAISTFQKSIENKKALQLTEYPLLRKQQKPFWFFFFLIWQGWGLFFTFDFCCFGFFFLFCLLSLGVGVKSVLFICF